VKITAIAFMNAYPPVFQQKNNVNNFKTNIAGKDTVCFGVRYKDLDEEALWDEAKALYDQEKYKEAIALYDQIIKKNESNARAFFKRGLAYLHMGKLEQAEDDFRMASTINPRLSDAQGFVAVSLKLQGLHDEAMEHCDKAIEIDSDNSFIYCVKASIYLEQGHSDLALNNIEMAIDLSPNDPDYYFLKGRILNEKGAFADALECFENAHNCFDETENREIKFPSILVMKAKCKNELELYHQALQDCNEVLTLDTNNDVAYFERARANFNLQKDLDALEDMNNAIKHNDKNHTYYYLRGFIKKCLGDYNSAVQDFEQSYKLNPNEIDTIMELGECNLTLRQNDEAIKYLKMAEVFFLKENDEESLKVVQSVLEKITAS